MKSFVDEGPTIRIYYDLEGQRRKDLVKALGEILLWEPKYLGAPTFSYQVGNYIITQIGAIICPECCTKEIAQQIMLKLRERGFDHTGTNLMLYVVTLPRSMFDDMSLARLRNLVKSKETILKAALGSRDLQIETTDEKVYFPWFTLSGADGEAEGVAAATASGVHGAAGAGEDRLRAVDGLGRDRAGAKLGDQAVDSRGLTGFDLRGLVNLAGLSAGIHEVAAQVRVLALLCGQLALDAVQFELAQLVADSLHLLVHMGQDGVERSRQSRPVVAGFLRDGVLEVCGAGSGRSRACLDRGLDAEALLHVGHLATVRRDLRSGEAVVDGAGDGVAGLADVLIDAGNAELNITEASGHTVLQAVDTGLKRLVTEAVRHVLGVVEPRVEVVQAEAVHAAAHHHGPHHAASEAASEAPAIAADQEQEQNPRPVTAAEAEAATVPAVAIRGSYRHVEAIAGAFICECHCVILSPLIMGSAHDYPFICRGVIFAAACAPVTGRY